MKKIFKSKKTLAALCLLLVAVVAAGGTFAWFTWTVDSEYAEVEFGRLSIAAEYAEGQSHLLQPGGSAVSKTGEVFNTGSLSAVAKVDLREGTVTIRSDEDGREIDTPWELSLSHEWAEGITVEIDMSKTDVAGVGANPADDYYLWLYHPATGDYYIYMYGDISAEMAFSVEADGSIGNLFQGAVINFSQGWEATQTVPAAIQDVFGIDESDLVIATPASGIAPASSNSLAEEIYALFLADLAANS